MQDLRPVGQIKMKVKDVFPMKELIKVIEEWFEENHYADFESGSEDYESVYTHKALAGGNIIEVWQLLRVVKYPLGTTKDTAYLRYLINIDLHFLGDAAEAEVLHKGKKIKLHKGEIEIIINPYVEIDFRNEWKSEGILGLMNDVFKKRIYKKDIEQHWVTLYSDAYKLQGMLKTFLKLESVGPPETVSMPPKGLI